MFHTSLALRIVEAVCPAPQAWILPFSSIFHFPPTRGADGGGGTGTKMKSKSLLDPNQSWAPQRVSAHDWEGCQVWLLSAWIAKAPWSVVHPIDWSCRKSWIPLDELEQHLEPQIVFPTVFPVMS